MNNVERAVRVLSEHSLQKRSWCTCGALISPVGDRLFLLDWDRHLAEALDKADLLKGEND